MSDNILERFKKMNHVFSALRRHRGSAKTKHLFHVKEARILLSAVSLSELCCQIKVKAAMS